MANVTYVHVTSLRLIPEHSRRIFFWIILVISIIALIGNVFAVGSIVKKKQKCLQKVCIISLALADIFSVVMFGVNNLESLSKELKTWSLGEFLCYFIPMGQVLGTTASSFALLVIALDRYQNVTVAIISKRWNPSMWSCILVVVASWIICAVTSYPMYIFFTFNPVQIVYTDEMEPIFEDAYMCVSTAKNSLMLYYILMALLIFLPIVLIFSWFYYQIAALIWRHRKPVTSKFSEKSSTEGTYRKKETSEVEESNPKSIIKKPKNVQMERKLRTFKVVIVLMVAFTICRLPYWLYFVIKLVRTIPGSVMWDINFALICLNILNCALNPFLYTFLNQTISATKTINYLTCKLLLCCCCFSSSDFEDFEKNNPFETNCEQKKDVENHGKAKSSKVKFIDVGHQRRHADGQPPDKPKKVSVKKMETF